MVIATAVIKAIGLQILADDREVDGHSSKRPRITYVLPSHRGYHAFVDMHYYDQQICLAYKMSWAAFEKLVQQLAPTFFSPGCNAKRPIPVKD